MIIKTIKLNSKKKLKKKNKFFISSVDINDIKLKRDVNNINRNKSIINYKRNNSCLSIRKHNNKIIPSINSYCKK